MRQSQQLFADFEDVSHDDYDDKRAKQRGKICNLCCSRFHINTLFTTSFKQIEAYDLAITGTQAQSESGIKQLQKIDEENALKLERDQIRLEQAEGECEELETTIFKYQSEIEQNEADK